MARRAIGETKKHIARAERERRQRRWILGATITVASLLVAVLLYGIYDSTYVQPYKPVAEVNDEVITSGEFEGRVRLIQREILNQLTSYVQMESFFGADPGILEELRNLQLQLQTQLANPEVLGRDILESLVLQRLLIVEAEQQGIEVTEGELLAEVQRNFNYYPDGTPTRAPTLTAMPTATLDPELITPTASASPGPSPTTVPTSTNLPPATPYTQDAYLQDYDNFIDSLGDFRIREQDFLDYIYIGLLEAKLRSNFTADIDREQEQVMVMVMVAESEETAAVFIDRLAAGETWEDLVAELSIDALTREAGGELGWRTAEDLIRTYGEPGLAVFAASEGETVGPVPAGEQGFYLFQVVERADRPISDEAYQLELDQAFNVWVQELRDAADVKIIENWQKYLPPAVPLSS